MRLPQKFFIIEPAEREHGGRALHEKPHAKARSLSALFLVVRKREKALLYYEYNSFSLQATSTHNEGVDIR